MDKDTENPKSTPGIVSTKLEDAEYTEFMALRGSIGISTSHFVRALVRLGVQSIDQINPDAREALILKLIKLGE